MPNANVGFPPYGASRQRYAHLAPDHLAAAANRLDPLLEGYDLATLEKKKGVSKQR